MGQYHRYRLLNGAAAGPLLDGGDLCHGGIIEGVRGQTEQALVGEGDYTTGCDHQRHANG